MKKVVNGKVIHIEDTEVFESAERSLLRDRKCYNLVEHGLEYRITENLEEAYEFIELYDNIYNSLPYPLYALDTPIKYVTIGALMYSVSEHIQSFEKENSLVVIFGNGIEAIQFINNSYRFVEIDYEDSQREFIKNIDSYKEMKYFKYFDFVYSALTSSDTDRQNNVCTDFYREWFSDILKVCDEDSDIAAELSKILKVRDVPVKHNFKTNCVKDIGTGEEYYIDFISEGIHTTKLEDTTTCINLVTGNVRSTHETDDTEIWNMNVMYKKDKKSPMIKAETIRAGINTLGMFMCSLKESSGSSEFSDYKAIIVDCILLVEIDGEIYYTYINKLRPMTPVTDRARIYSVDGSNVYIQTYDQSEGIVKERSTYVFNVRKRELELCRISYEV